MRALACAAAILAIPATALGAWNVRVVVEAPSPWVGDPGTVPDAQVNQVLLGTLDGQTARAVRDTPAAVRKIKEILAFLGSPGGEGWRLDVRATREKGGTLVVRLVLRGRATVLHARDIERPGSSEVELPQATFRLSRRPETPPSPPVASWPPAATPEVPDALPPPVDPCRAGDAACWLRSTLVPGREPACTRYLSEAESHRRRLDQFGDPNVGWKEPADLDAPALDRAEHMKLVGQKYPSGTRIDVSNFAEMDRSTRERPSSGPGLPRDPSDECKAEWASQAPGTLPTLACALEAERWERWVLRDPVARAATLPVLSAIGSLPILSNYLAFRGRQAADDRSGDGMWAARWMDRVATAFQGGNDRLLDAGMAVVAGRADERKSLARHLRRWADRAEYRDWQPVIDRIYGEFFTSLYPEAADRAGLPVLDRFPVRLWWATNWVAAVRRTGLDPGNALDLLRCAPDGERSVAVLKDLAPWLKGRARYRVVIEAIEARL